MQIEWYGQSASTRDLPSAAGPVAVVPAPP